MSEIRKARLSELDEIMLIYARAKKFMHESGNTTQWPGEYPQRDFIEWHIGRGELYVLAEEERIDAVFALIEGPDETYAKIYDGAWLDDSHPYYVVHRLAAAGEGRGAAAKCFDWCFEKCANLRVDTHRDNAPMLHVLKKCGFTICGNIIIEDGTPRVAFQKIKFVPKETMATK